jgi:hypothetical protein
MDGDGLVVWDSVVQAGPSHLYVTADRIVFVPADVMRITIDGDGSRLQSQQAPSSQQALGPTPGRPFALFHRPAGTLSTWRPVRCASSPADPREIEIHRGGVLIDLRARELLLSSGAYTLARCRVHEARPEFALFVLPSSTEPPVSSDPVPYRFTVRATCLPDGRELTCPSFSSAVPVLPETSPTWAAVGAPFNVVDEEVSCAEAVVSGGSNAGSASSAQLSMEATHRYPEELSAWLSFRPDSGQPPEPSGNLGWVDATIFERGSLGPLSISDRGTRRIFVLDEPVPMPIAATPIGTWKLCVRDAGVGQSGWVYAWSVSGY